MSKNTSSNAFRRIDVDQYNEDNYREELDNDPTLDGPNENEIMSLLSQSKGTDALKNVLQNAPVGNKNQEAKDASLDLFMRVMMSIKTSQIDSCVEGLDNEQRDILMKYIYKGFEKPIDDGKSSAHLLVWHEKLFAVAGIGSVVRVLTDKKKV